MKNHLVLSVILLALPGAVLAEEGGEVSQAASAGSKKNCYPIYVDNVRKSSCDKAASSYMIGNKSQRNGAMVSSKPRVWSGTSKSKKQSLFRTRVNANANSTGARGSVNSSVNLGF